MKGLPSCTQATSLTHDCLIIFHLRPAFRSNRTYAFAALLQLLRQPPESVAPEQLAKFYDLVVKCLIKLTKSLQANTEVCVGWGWGGGGGGGGGAALCVGRRRGWGRGQAAAGLFAAGGRCTHERAA